MCLLVSAEIDLPKIVDYWRDDLVFVLLCANCLQDVK